jgi:hypothetical protein
VADAGHPYVRFQRALERGSLELLLASAAEVPRLSSDDALAVCARVAREDPDRFDAYARRWLLKLLEDHEEISVDEIAAGMIALLRLRGGAVTDRTGDG